MQIEQGENHINVGFTVRNDVADPENPDQESHLLTQISQRYIHRLLLDMKKWNTFLGVVTIKMRIFWLWLHYIKIAIMFS